MKTKFTALTLGFLMMGATLHASAQAKHDIKLNLKPGQKFEMKSEIKTPNTTSVMGQTIFNDITMHTVLTTECTGAKDGTFDMSTVTQEITMDAAAMGMKQHISSKDAPNDMNKPFVAMTGKPVKYKVDTYYRAQGEVSAPELEAALQTALPGQSGAVMEQMKSNVSLGFYYPAKPVAVGETFPIDHSMSNGQGGETKLKGTGKLSRVTDTEYILDYKLDCSADVQGSTITGSGTMKAVLDRTTGMIKNSVMKLQMSGTITVQGMTAEIQMENNTTITCTLIK